MSEFSLDARVAVAIIAALSAVAVAIIQLVYGFRRSRDIERLKHQLESRKDAEGEMLKRYLESKVDGGTREINGYREMVEAVQRLRDHAARVRARPSSFANERLQTEVAGLTEALSTAFGEAQVDFGEDVYLVAHALKNRCLLLGDTLVDWHQSVVGGLSKDAALEEKLAVAESDVRAGQSELRSIARGAVESFTRSLRPPTL